MKRFVIRVCFFLSSSVFLFSRVLFVFIYNLWWNSSLGCNIILLSKKKRLNPFCCLRKIQIWWYGDKKKEKKQKCVNKGNLIDNKNVREGRRWRRWWSFFFFAFPFFHQREPSWKLPTSLYLINIHFYPANVSAIVESFISAFLFTFHRVQWPFSFFSSYKFLLCWYPKKEKRETDGQSYFLFIYFRQQKDDYHSLPVL